MSGKQLALWAEGQETVKVTVRGGALVIAHRVSSESRERSLLLPVRRGLLLALREACDQALRAEVIP